MGVEDSLAKTKWFKAVESVQEGSADNKISGKELEKKTPNCQFLGKETLLFSPNLTKKINQLLNHERGKRIYLGRRTFGANPTKLLRSPAAALTPIYLSGRHMTCMRLTFAPRCG